MTTQYSFVSSCINVDEFDQMLHRSLNRCLSSSIHDMLKGKKIIFNMDERTKIPINGWGMKSIPYCATTINPIKPILENTTVSAIDSSSIQVAETEEGTLYAVKCGIVMSSRGQTFIHLRIGPILFYLSKETIRDSEIDHRLAKLILFDNECAKRLIRVRIERAVQMIISNHFKRSIILIDGSLKPSLFEDKDQSIKNVAENCALNRNSMIGISKSTKFKILDKISSSLTKIPGPAYMDVNLVIKSLIRNTIGDSVIVKFGNGNSAILRADIVTSDRNKYFLFGKLLGNDSMADGYPETLRLAHHISTFTNTEVSCLKGHILSSYEVTELASEDIRRTLLGSLLI